MTTHATTTMFGALLFWCPVAAIAEHCLSAWKQNPVSQYCKVYASAVAPEQKVPMVIDLENGQCRMTVTCKNQYGGGTPNLGKDIDKAMVKDIHNCNGDLQVDPC
jgi:hypothetical protein